VALFAVTVGVIAGVTSASASGIDKVKLNRSLATAFAHLYRMWVEGGSLRASASLIRLSGTQEHDDDPPQRTPSSASPVALIPRMISSTVGLRSAASARG
jgi:hypothetical protein